MESASLEPPLQVKQVPIGIGAAISWNEDTSRQVLRQEILSSESQDMELTAPIVTVRNANVNIRRGPGLNYRVITTAPSGTTFDVIGVSTDGGWWLICCVQQGPNGSDAPGLRGWISNSVVTANPAARSVSVVSALLPDDMSARWAVDYTCSSERCTVPACTGKSTARVERKEDRVWLQVAHAVVWDGDCGDNSSWERIVDRFTGQDWLGTDSEALFNYWKGMSPGPVNGLHAMSGNQRIRVWCRDLRKELDEGNGWSADYAGTVCYDQKTGLLARATYKKLWFFTGTFEGDEYLNAYFGDQESYQLRLEETNIPLSLIAPNRLRSSQR